MQSKIFSKEPRPSLIRLKQSDTPKQNRSNQINPDDCYMSFTRHIDLFYLFEEKKVKQIQQQVQEVCVRIIEEQQKYEIDEEFDNKNAYNIGDLVFGIF